jgi:hypothetical protein
VAINRPYGEVYRFNDTQVTECEIAEQWYHSQNLVAGAFMGLEYHNGSDDCHVYVPTGMEGSYKIDWSSSAAGETGKIYEIGISVAGSMILKSVSQRKMGSTDVGAMSGQCVVYINANSDICLNVRCMTAGGGDSTCKHANMTVVKV